LLVATWVAGAALEKAAVRQTLLGADAKALMGDAGAAAVGALLAGSRMSAAVWWRPSPGVTSCADWRHHGIRELQRVLIASGKSPDAATTTAAFAGGAHQNLVIRPDPRPSAFFCWCRSL